MADDAKHVSLLEVGPRDGLQNESKHIPATDKIKLVDMLSEAGFDSIEVTSFVSAKWIPQLADAAEVMHSIKRNPGICYAVLTPNMRGFDDALAAGADEVGIFGAASEGFSQKNINCTIAESYARFRPVAEAAKANGIPVRGTVSTVIACPYDGPTPPEKVTEVAVTLLEMGCYEIALGDTIGAGNPDTIAAMLDHITRHIEPEKLAGHYHDTGDNAISNVDTSLEYGLRRFDSAAAGLGGCPYAPGAKGNVSTGALARHLNDNGWHTGIDLEKLGIAEDFIKNLGVSEKGEKNV